ncbi:MAG: TrmH family RNA methyltransferase [Acidimicrobiales bacterium]
MTTTPIADADDPRVAEYLGLTDAELRRGVEGTGGAYGEGLFIVEGTLAIGELLASGWSVRSVLVTEKKLPELDQKALLDTGASVFVAPKSVLNQVVGFNLHRGAVACADRPIPVAMADVLHGAVNLVMLEGINDQENLGVIFRNAAALGADGVLLSPTCCDPLYRRTVRVSMGHVVNVPFTTSPPWPDAIEAVREAGFEAVALTPDDEAENIDSYRGVGERVAVLLGSEGPGLTSAAMTAADRRVRIPMSGTVDSLNVAAAAAIGFHQLFRKPT